MYVDSKRHAFVTPDDDSHHAVILGGTIALVAANYRYSHAVVGISAYGITKI